MKKLFVVICILGLVGCGVFFGTQKTIEKKIKAELDRTISLYETQPNLKMSYGNVAVDLIGQTASIYNMKLNDGKNLNLVIPEIKVSEYDMFSPQPTHMKVTANSIDFGQSIGPNDPTFDAALKKVNLTRDDLKMDIKMSYDFDQETKNVRTDQEYNIHKLSGITISADIANIDVEEFQKLHNEDLSTPQAAQAAIMPILGKLEINKLSVSIKNNGLKEILLKSMNPKADAKMNKQMVLGMLKAQEQQLLQKKMGVLIPSLKQLHKFVDKGDQLKATIAPKEKNLQKLQGQIMMATMSGQYYKLVKSLGFKIRAQ